MVHAEALGGYSKSSTPAKRSTRVSAKPGSSGVSRVSPLAWVAGFPGTIVFVSHDQAFVAALATHELTLR
ncbi:MAG: hypothetical protein JWM80_849 [Cyanobacteria bacterium RYN_339]|nr:hypothetical protein [Cyanobacteria bacterium RYN_339]